MLSIELLGLAVECNLSIHLGAPFFWCLTLLVAGLASVLSWQGSRILHERRAEIAFQKGQLALTGRYIPIDRRTPTQRITIPEARALEVMRIKPEAQRPKNAAPRGWRKMDDYYHLVAAE